MDNITTNELIAQLQAENRSLRAEKDCYKTWYFQAITDLTLERTKLIEYIKDYYKDTRFAYEAEQMCIELDEIVKEMENETYVS